MLADNDTMSFECGVAEVCIPLSAVYFRLTGDLPSAHLHIEGTRWRRTS